MKIKGDLNTVYLSLATSKSNGKHSTMLTNMGLYILEGAILTTHACCKI